KCPRRRPRRSSTRGRPHAATFAQGDFRVNPVPSAKRGSLAAARDECVEPHRLVSPFRNRLPGHQPSPISSSCALILFRSQIARVDGCVLVQVHPGKQSAVWAECKTRNPRVRRRKNSLELQTTGFFVRASSQDTP